jgi:hypothetical protein
MTRYLSLAVLLFTVPLSAVADIYKCTDKDGHVVFQPVPCGKRSEQAEQIDVERLLAGQNRMSLPIQTSSILNKNLLRNAAFEQQLGNWLVPTDAHWLPAQGVNGSGVLQLAAPKPPDDKYIHETVVRQCVPIEDGVKFSLGGMFRHEGRSNRQHANRLRVIWYESLDCTSGGQFGTYVEPRDVTGWQRLSRTDITPALGAKAARVEIKQNGRYTNNAKAYWDFIYLIATEVSTVTPDKPGYRLPVDFDFIENGDFRRDLSAWHTGWESEWVGYTGHHFTGAIKVTASSRQGSIGKSAFNQCVNFGASSRFAMGASFRRADTSTQKGSGRLRVTWYEQGDCHGRAKAGRSVDPDEGAGWQVLRLDELKAAPGSISARVEIIQSILGPGEFSTYWDDIYFKTRR